MKAIFANPPKLSKKPASQSKTTNTQDLKNSNSILEKKMSKQNKTKSELKQLVSFINSLLVTVKSVT